MQQEPITPYPIGPGTNQTETTATGITHGGTEPIITGTEEEPRDLSLTTTGSGDAVNGSEDTRHDNLPQTHLHMQNSSITPGTPEENSSTVDPTANTITASQPPPRHFHPSPVQAALVSYNWTGKVCAIPADPDLKSKKIHIPTASGFSSNWKEFQNAPPANEQISSWFTMEHPGLAVVCGKVSGGLVCIDFDLKDDPTGGALWEKIDTLIPSDIKDKLVIEKTQRGGKHIFFRTDRPIGTRKLAAQSGHTKQHPLEGRGEGSYVICAPTPGYERIQGGLDNVSTLTEAEVDQLYAAVRTAALQSGCVWLEDLKSNVSAENAVDTTSSAAGGPLTPLDDFDLRGDPVPILTKHGWQIDQHMPDGTIHLTRPGKDAGTSATWNHDQSRKFMCFSSNTDFEMQPSSYGASAVYARLECGGDFSQAAANLREQGYGASSTITTGVPTVYPDPKPLVDPVNILVPWDYDLLPAEFQPYVRYIAEDLQCPPEFPAVGIMSALSSVCSRSFVVCPKKAGTWFEHPNLWSIVIGPPASSKSPALKMAMRPFQKLESLYRKKSEEDLRSWTTLSEEKKMQTPPPLQRRRFIVNDATAPALVEMLFNNPVKSALLYQDELSGLLSTIIRNDPQNLEQFLLSGWSGKETYTSDRIKRKVQELPEYSITVCGGIQPDRLEATVLNQVLGVKSGTGLLQRFSLMVYPVPPASVTEHTPTYNAADEMRVEEVFRRMAEPLRTSNSSLTLPLHPDLHIPELRFTDEAQAVFQNWLINHMKWLREEKLTPVLQGHFTKYSKLVPAMAALLHIVDHPDEIQIGVESLDKAIRWSKFLQSHAEKIFSGAPEISDTNKQAYNLLERLMAAYKDQDFFTVRQVGRNGWSGFKDGGFLKRIFSILTDNHWLIHLDDHKFKGRKTDRYMINPKARSVSR